MELYDMAWYRLPISYQKQIQCTIHSAQNGAVLGTSPTNEFDFEAASHVSRTTLILCQFSLQNSVLSLSPFSIFTDDKIHLSNHNVVDNAI